MSARKTKGFTLIELLVVIAIIAILAAILFPVFAKAREKARQSQCMSNLKNSALALRMYSSDYDERLPFGIPVAPLAPCTVAGWCNGPLSTTQSPALGTICRTDHSCGWTYESQAYIKNTQVLLCPNWNKVTLVGVQGPNGRNIQADQFFVTTYMLSSSLVGAAESELGNPANKVMLYEILPYHHDVTVTVANARLDQNVNLPIGPLGQKNAAIVICAFADGHTKVMNMNNSKGSTGACGNRNGSMGQNNANSHTGRNAAGGNGNPQNATKWNLNAGWDPLTAQGATACNQPATAAAGNTSPLGLTGRMGVNF